MEVRVLGPVEVVTGGDAVRLARRQHRLVLGILALEANRVITPERLMRLVWGDAPPRQARAVLHSRISELRATLAATQDDQTAGLLTQGGGYVLAIPADLVDGSLFKKILRQAHEARTDSHARTLLRRALGLWRGPVLGGWLPQDPHAELCRGLESSRITAAENLFDIELRLGNHRLVVDEMVMHLAANPSRERLTGQTMYALFHAGRPAEATQAYDRYRRWLKEGLGLDPGTGLQELHRAILRGDNDLTFDGLGLAEDDTDETRLDRPSIGASIHRRADVVPRLLPPLVTDFIGREPEITHILHALRGEGTGALAITGPGGVGKTALCLEAARQLAEGFPDAHLYADLKGTDENPATPSEVLGRFLRALGLESVPDDTAERVDLYRSMLANRRVLVMLDNAADAEQVRPLLPSSATCAALINGRGRLGPELGVETLELDLLSPTQSVALLARIAGERRITTEPDAAEQIASLCGHLPLAIRVAAAKLVARPRLALARLALQLDDAQGRLSQFAYGQLDVRSSIALSYRGLTSTAKTLMRRLGDLGMSEFTAWIAAALVEVPTVRADEMLCELYDAQLIQISGQDVNDNDRYRFHDLIRIFAKERAQAEESDDELLAARSRVYSAWLHVLEAVHSATFGGRYESIPGNAPRFKVEESQISTLTADPFSWFDQERFSIVEAVKGAAHSGLVETCWEVAITASPLFQMRRYFDLWQHAIDVALSVTQRAVDPVGHAALVYRLGSLSADRQQYAAAHAHFDNAAKIFDEHGHDYGKAVASVHAALMDRWGGRYERALDRLTHAIPILDEAGDHGACAMALRNIGQVHLEREEFEESDTYMRRSLDVARLGRARDHEAQTLFWSGMLALRQNQLPNAERNFAEVLSLTVAIGDRPGQVQAHRGLGLCYQAMGDFERAETALTEALRLATQPRPTHLERRVHDDLTHLAALRRRSEPPV